MKPVVIVDTNVAIVANDKTEQASRKCTLECIKRLEKIQRDEKLLLDAEGYILKEYREYLRYNDKEPGGAFYKWAYNNQGDPNRCERIPIAPDPDREFAEFPESDALAGFDRNDRKFVAVALASGESPSILNATDTDWQEYRQPLEEHGIRIEFLCPELMEDS